MSLVQCLSTLAMRPLAEGACRSIGMTAGAMVADKTMKLLIERFTDQSQRLTVALTESQERAWRTLEMALAGDSFWQRCKGVLQKGEDVALQSHFKQVLAGLDRRITGDNPDSFRQDCLTELRQAKKNGQPTGSA